MALRSVLTAITLAATLLVGLGMATRPAFAAKYSAIVVDADTGTALYANNPDQRSYPASLTKMMTLYMLFDAMKAGKVRLDTRMGVSKHAAAQSPSKLGLRPGQTITVDDAIKAIVTKSANDVAVVIAEHLGGSETAFAASMTGRAKALGMTRTTYRNASGLPNPGQMSTARDQATLSIALRRNFPQYYHYFAVKSFAFRGKVIPTHNRVLLNYPGADGLKTGYIRASGFNLAASAQRNGVSLVGVVFGGATGAWRDQHMMELLDTGFQRAASTAVAGKAPRRLGPPVTSLAMVDAPPAQDPPQDDAVALAPPATSTPAAFASHAPATPPLVLTPPASMRTAATPAVKLTDPATRAKPSQQAKATPPTKAARQTKPEAVERWGVQVGAFSSQDNARRQAENAARAVRRVTGPAVAEVSAFRSTSGKGGSLYRARVMGLDGAKEARAACSHLTRTAKLTCSVVAPRGVDVAQSR